MVRIFGSIDNASTGGTINHLIFTANEILQFQVMEKSERLVILGSATEATSLSLLKHYSPKTAMFHRISSLCLERGKDVEKHINDHLGAEREGYTSMDYSAITDVVLSGDNMYSLHSLAFKYKGQEVKYFLVHEGGKIPDDVFISYKNALGLAFPDNWRISKGVRMRNTGLSALKIGALGAVPVAAALFLLAIFQHATVTLALIVAIFIYVLSFGSVTEISHEVFMHRRLRELQSTTRSR